MTNSPFTTIVLILLMVLAFYFLILRPQKKRQQAQQKTMSELTPGTRVLLGSGVFGTITWVGSKQAILEIAPGVELTVLKQAIARVVTPGDEYAEPVDVIDEPAGEPTAEGTPEAPLAEPSLPATPVTDSASQARRDDADGTTGGSSTSGPTTSGPTSSRE
jgi:preprotein translocase subunit YajC